MNNLSPEQKLIAELNGQVHAMRVCIAALMTSMPPEQQPFFAASLRTLAEQEKATLLGLTVPDEAIQAFSAALLSMQLTADQLNS